MKISFRGAAGEVTGSCSLVEVAGAKLLVDCGMFQGSADHDLKNTEPFSFDASTLDAVLVTHAHLDHTGRLPMLTRNGYSGLFYATPATIELTELILRDALEVMVYNHTHYGNPILFDESDIGAVMAQFKAVDYHEPQRIESDNGGATFTFYDAGHIFGSAFVLLEAEGKRVVFSGDVGNVNAPILKDTEPLPDSLDALICESTYGDRAHDTATGRQELINKYVSEAIKRGGTLMIPAFSLERTQELIYELNELIEHHKALPKVPIFLDSPLAIGATRVYRKYHKYYDTAALKLLDETGDLFRFPSLTMCETREESKKINMVQGTKIIIAGAGMMNGGRIVHHAIRYLGDPANTLLVIGYMASGTLGRRILEGESPVEIMKEKIAVHCKIEAIGALSAHGDKEKLTSWISGPIHPPKQVWLNHGEPLPSSALAKKLMEEKNIKATPVRADLEVEI